MLQGYEMIKIMFSEERIMRRKNIYHLCEMEKAVCKIVCTIF